MAAADLIRRDWRLGETSGSGRSKASLECEALYHYLVTASYFYYCMVLDTVGRSS
ncbi:hypothetical protein C2845_PM15G15080 [Panicum miliaceum]|uniref:Uncharacterized protein n=1 Tax=Panicum miliaceum TaxID=4540 RepID=A0A3L6Q8I1_PANMI|nr:hypothetical protein C2845_PM15G15080 [Panicum miliaceum]